jgi:hypothetical protein
MALPPVCVESLPPVVHLVVVNEAGASPPMLEAAAAETRAIWATAGLQLTWRLRALDESAAADGTIIVVIRHKIVPRANAPARLGQIAFGADGRPANLIEVSFDAVRALVMRSSPFDHPVPRLPAVTQWMLLGRGLGRVVAHEMGHWFFGQGHARAGIMKPALAGPDLTDARRAQLPPGWAEMARCRPARAAPGQEHAPCVCQ